MTTPALNRAGAQRSTTFAKEVFRAFHVLLPGYAYWTVSNRDRMDPENDEGKDCLLGGDAPQVHPLCNNYPRAAVVATT